MRRDVIINEVQTVLSDIVGSGMVSMLEEGLSTLRNRQPNDKDLRWIDVSVIFDYAKRVSVYSPTQRYIISVFGLNALSDPKIWQEQLEAIDSTFIYAYNSQISNAVEFCPRFLRLLERDSDEYPKNSESGDDVIVQRIILTDEGENLSSPQRIIELLQSIEQIYLVICEANQMPGQKIAIVSIDSGSEKSFDFLGVAKLMQELRETLQSIYNMISFHKQNVTLKNLQVAGETLSVVEQITRLEHSKMISSEDASRMKHSLFSGLEKFAGTGAYTPEMNAISPVPSLVMRPQTRLLTGPADSLVREANEYEGEKQSEVKKGEVEPSSDGAQDIDLTDEEIIAVINSLRSKRARATSTKRPRQSKPKNPQ